MKSGNKKGILLLIFISIILCVACLIEYALLSSSREQNRKLRSGQVQAENSRKATAAKKKQELAGYEQSWAFMVSRIHQLCLDL